MRPPSYFFGPELSYWVQFTFKTCFGGLLFVIRPPSYFFGPELSYWVQFTFERCFELEAHGAKRGVCGGHRAW
jgi:hypothetical protein